MTMASPELNAAIRAMCGESNLDAVWPVFGDAHLSRVVALAPDTQRIVRAVAALQGGLTALLDPQTIADPALHDAIARMIGTPEGHIALDSWAQIAPAEWGAKRADALVDAVTNTTCTAGVAAALIGPCDASAQLLRTSSDIAFAIRRWGRSSPDAPIAWMNALSAEERNRLINAALRVYNGASCIPWLPPDRAKRTRIHKDCLFMALRAFAEASPTARTLHADLLKRLIRRAQSPDLSELTRLACAMGSDEVWSRIVALVRDAPDSAARVVIAAPWDDLDATVCAAILEPSDQSDICAAIAAAHGRKYVKRIANYPAATFFAALDPTVWNAHPSAEQRRWRDALGIEHAYLAVRSLGPRPEFLAQAILDNNLVRAVQRHTRDDATLCWALLPVALRDLSPDEAHALITVLPTAPHDPSAFFVIASGHPNPDIIAAVGAARCTNADLARVVALQRCVDKRASVSARCTALQRALRGQTWDDLKLMMDIFDGNARAAMTPDLNALIERLALPNRQEQGRQALARLASLPFETVVPTCIALSHAMAENDADAAGACADALRDHGDVFLTIVDALEDERLRAALLPLPADAAQANALRNLAHDDPLAAHRLAHALRGQKWRTALHALLTAPPHAADAVWQAIDDAMRSDIIAAVAPTPSHGAPIITRDSFAALALAAVQSGDDDLRAAGIAALAAHHAIIRANWDSLRPETQQVLIAHQPFADLKITSSRFADQRVRRR